MKEKALEIQRLLEREAHLDSLGNVREEKVAQYHCAGEP